MNADLRKMANKAGIRLSLDHDESLAGFYGPATAVELEAFARLVAEDCAITCESTVLKAGCWPDVTKKVQAVMTGKLRAAQHIRAKYGIKP